MPSSRSFEDDAASITYRQQHTAFEDTNNQRATLPTVRSPGRTSSWSGKRNHHATRRHHSSRKSLEKTLHWRGQRLSCSSRTPPQRQTHAAKSYLHSSSTTKAHSRVGFVGQRQNSRIVKRGARYLRKKMLLPHWLIQI